MGAIYIGGQTKNTSGLNWKIYLFLISFLAIAGAILKFTAPMIVEKWINKNGSGDKGYAFSIRDVELSLANAQLILMDVKVFNPKTSNKIVEAPSITIQFNWPDFFQTQEKKFSVVADKMDLILSKDLPMELERILAADEGFYLDSVDGKIAKLNIIEQKEGHSRTLLVLNDLYLKVNEVALLSINKNTEFSVSSNIQEGGKLNVSGKTMADNGNTSWSIQGSMKKVRADIFNKMAGDKLPFSFNESHLDAAITAQSERGKVSGEIQADVKKLNLLQEKPGIPTQSMARALTDELTFTLPFTLKDELTLEYEETYQKLKTYRKYPLASDQSGTEEAQVSRI